MQVIYVKTPTRTKYTFQHYFLTLNKNKQINIADEYDNQWVTCFQEQGELMLGITSNELGKLKEGDEQGYEGALRKIYFKSYFMKMRVKNDRFNVGFKVLFGLKIYREFLSRSFKLF